MDVDVAPAVSLSTASYGRAALEGQDASKVPQDFVKVKATVLRLVDAHSGRKTPKRANDRLAKRCLRSLHLWKLQTAEIRFASTRKELISLGVIIAAELKASWSLYFAAIRAGARPHVLALDVTPVGFWWGRPHGIVCFGGRAAIFHRVPTTRSGACACKPNPNAWKRRAMISNASAPAYVRQLGALRAGPRVGRTPK